MSELKPCPFCGSEADLDWGGATDIGGALHQNGWVCCTNPDCDATVDVDSIDDSKSDIDLINKWNKRAETETEKRLTADRQNAISLMSNSWQHDSENQDDLMTRYVTMAENQFNKKDEEIERLTELCAEKADRCDKLYEALEGMIGIWKLICNANGWDENHLIQAESAKEVLDKSRTETDK